MHGAHPTDAAVIDAAQRAADAVALTAQRGGDGALPTDNAGLQHPRAQRGLASPPPPPLDGPLQAAPAPPQPLLNPLVGHHINDGEQIQAWRERMAERDAQPAQGAHTAQWANVAHPAGPALPAPAVQRRDEIDVGSPGPGQAAIIEGLPPPRARAQQAADQRQQRASPHPEPQLERQQQASPQPDEPQPRQQRHATPALGDRPGHDNDGFHTAREQAGTPSPRPLVGDPVVAGLLAQLEAALQGRATLDQLLRPRGHEAADFPPVTPGTLPLSPAFDNERLPPQDALLGGLRLRPGPDTADRAATFYVGLNQQQATRAPLRADQAAPAAALYAEQRQLQLEPGFAATNLLTRQAGAGLQFDRPPPAAALLGVSDGGVAAMMVQMQQVIAGQAHIQRQLDEGGLSRLRPQAGRVVPPLQLQAPGAGQEAAGPGRATAGLIAADPDPDDPDDPGDSSSDDDYRNPARQPWHHTREHTDRTFSAPVRAVPAAPRFTAAEGALPNRKYLSDMQSWFSSNSCNLEAKMHYQLTMLLASLHGSPAQAFFQAVRAELKWVCPPASTEIDALDATEGINNLHRFWSTPTDDSDRGSVSTVAGQASRSPLQKYMQAIAQGKRVHAQQAGIVVNDAMADDQEQAWREFHDGRIYRELIAAWLAVVQRLLTKPGADELAVWTGVNAQGEGNMRMGVVTIIDPDVQPNESPEAFGRRLITTFQILTEGAAEAFRERAGLMPPMTAFTNGLPKNFPRKQALFAELARLDTTTVDEFTRIAKIAALAQIFWVNAALVPGPAPSSASQASATRARPAPAEHAATPRRGGWSSRQRNAAVSHGEQGQEEWHPTAVVAEIQPLGMRPTQQQMRTTMQEQGGQQNGQGAQQGGRGSQGTQQGGRGGRGSYAGGHTDSTGGRGGQQAGRSDQGRASWQQHQDQRAQGHQGQRSSQAQAQGRGQGGHRSSSPSGCRFCKDPTHPTYECAAFNTASKEAERARLAQPAARQQQPGRAAATTQQEYLYAGTSVVYEGQFEWSLDSDSEDEIDITSVQFSSVAAAAQSLPPTALLHPSSTPGPHTLPLIPSSSSDFPGYDSGYDSDGSCSEQLATLQAMLSSATMLGAKLLRRSERRTDPTWRAKKEFPVSFQPVKAGKASGASPTSATCPPTANPAPKPGSTLQRPISFNVACVPEVPTVGQYQTMLSNNSTLTYFANPRDKLERCVGIMLEGTDVVYININMLVDTGANVCCITKKLCNKLGIPILPTTMRLATSTSEGNSLVGVTPPVALIYGVAHPNVLVVWHLFYVTEDVDGIYQVLIGNLDTDRYGAVIDTGSRVLTMRPQFQHMGVNSAGIPLDLCRKGAGRASQLLVPARMALVTSTLLTTIPLTLPTDQMHFETSMLQLCMEDDASHVAGSEAIGSTTVATELHDATYNGKHQRAVSPQQHVGGPASQDVFDSDAVASSIEMADNEEGKRQLAKKVGPPPGQAFVGVPNWQAAPSLWAPQLAAQTGLSPSPNGQGLLVVTHQPMLTSHLQNKHQADESATGAQRPTGLATARLHDATPATAVLLGATSAAAALHDNASAAAALHDTAPAVAVPHYAVLAAVLLGTTSAAAAPAASATSHQQAVGSISLQHAGTRRSWPWLPGLAGQLKAKYILEEF